MSAAELSTVPIPDGHLAYRDVGAGEALVLLHGGALDHRMWDEQVSAFASRYRVIAPDARSHGRSSTATAPFRQCDDVAALLRHLDPGPATLVGLSMGGGTAVDTALEHPELVRALVVCGAGTSEPYFEDPWALGIFAEWARTQAAKDVEGWVDAFLLFAAGPHRSLDEVDPVLVQRLRDMATYTVVTHAASGPPQPVPVTSTWERLPQITQPVLAIIGGLDSDDHIGMAERLVRTVPNGRAAVVKGTAHYPNLERPDEFDAVLGDFLGSGADGR